jgi:hypothetical protein
MGWSIKKALKGAGGAIEDATHVVGSEAERGAQSVNREWKHWARQRGIAIQLANDRADRYSAAARIRRRTGGNQPGNKGGTLLTGALGLLGGTSPTLGSA